MRFPLSKVVHLTLLAFLLFALAGCFTVRTAHDPNVEQCDMATHKLELQYSEAQMYNTQWHATYNPQYHSSSEKELAALVVMMAAVPVTSFVVSGSVVVVGNIVHWVEYQGKCEDSAVRSFTSSVTQGIVDAGGVVVDSADALFSWIMGNE